MKLFLNVVLAALLAFSSYGQMTRTYSRLAASDEDVIDKLMEHVLDTCKIAGASIGIVVEGEVAYLAGYGYRDAANGLQADGNTLFRTASICKPLAGLIANIVADGSPEFSISDKVNKWIPHPLIQSTTAQVYDLMDHDAGMCNYGCGWSSGSVITYDAGITTSEYQWEFDPLFNAHPALEIVENMGIPNTGNNYSTAHYMILGAIIEKVSGMRFQELMKELITDPLNMHRYQPEYPWVEYHNITKKYSTYPYETTGEDQIIYKLPSGGFLSSAADMALFLRHHINGGYPDHWYDSVSGLDPTHIRHTGASHLSGYRTGMETNVANRCGAVIFSNSSGVNKDYFYYDLFDSIMEDVLPGMSLSPWKTAYDESEGIDNISTLSGIANDYGTPDVAVGDEVRIKNYQTAMTSSKGDVRILADDRVVFLPNTEINEGTHLVAAIENVGENYPSFGPIRERTASSGSETKSLPASSSEGNLKVVPNPTKGRVQLIFDAAVTKVEVWNMLGERIRSRSITQGQSLELDLSDQPKGIYVARTTNESGQTNFKRFIVQ